MAKSCKGLAMELVKCLSESDCVKVCVIRTQSYRKKKKKKKKKEIQHTAAVDSSYTPNSHLKPVADSLPPSIVRPLTKKSLLLSANPAAADDSSCCAFCPFRFLEKTTRTASKQVGDGGSLPLQLSCRHGKLRSQPEKEQDRSIR
ncbi:hypothetical protein B296_00013697 [Ensete ventricosum]|uniref:Uncharacterized protein n=1 Tax=Ensete ventricosum TaxID=4639 RepID=A0A427B3X6_ENSVE|nr:hypothetical protein B296_00013697 [Ensete ventricosum]